MRKNYQGKAYKSNHKFEVVGGQELGVQVPLPRAEVWQMQAQVEELAGQAGLQILRPILENEVTRRVGPPASTKSQCRLCALGQAARLCGLLVDRRSKWNGHGYARAKAKRPRSGAEQLPAVAVRREAATSGEGRGGGGAVHAELSARCRVWCGRGYVAIYTAVATAGAVAITVVDLWSASSR